MSNFEIGEMFWGKSLSYPWWPCVIVPNDKNEVHRNTKKIGVQYHVQLIGPDFDVCWIADSSLIKFYGKNQFEKFVEERLTSDLPIQEKLRFDMRMSANVQSMWMQACIEAEKIYTMSATGRLSCLPLNPNVPPLNLNAISPNLIAIPSNRNAILPNRNAIPHNRNAIPLNRNAIPPNLIPIAPNLIPIAPNRNAILPNRIVPELLPKLAPMSAQNRRSLNESIVAKEKETMNHVEKRNAPKRSLTHVKYIDDESDVEFVDEGEISKKITPKDMQIKKPNMLENGNKPDIVTVTKEVVNEVKEKRKYTKRSYSKISDSGNISDSEYRPTGQIKNKKTCKKLYSKESEDNAPDNEFKRETRKKEIKEKESIIHNLCLSSHIEKRCFRAYLAQEMHYRIKSSAVPLDNVALADILKEQWAALDMDTKLLYLNDEITYLGESKSKVSGRQIKIPSRLRRTEDIAKIKRSSVKKCQSLPPVKKVEPQAELSVLSVKIENIKIPNSLNPSLSPNELKLQEHKDVIDSSIWSSLSDKDCSTEMLMLIVSKRALEIRKICYHCFETLTQEEEVITCKGVCQSSYHISCATRNKITLSEDAQLCGSCSQKRDVCSICKNSIYMKRRSLVKCQKEGCTYHFHVTCAEFLTLTDNNSDSNGLTFCPNHSCLTCVREDATHACARLGELVSCIKCPISYHENFVCIPAGCRIIEKNKIICYRHLDYNILSKPSQPSLRCFVCFDEEATLKCCRCRAVFHPRCLSMPTYTDLLRDYVCENCKLDRPLFHGQIVWIETDKSWSPAEIISPAHLSERFEQSLIVRDLSSGDYRFPNRCELIPFVPGLHVLKNFINFADPVVERAKEMALLYWNWRLRLRPVTSHEFQFLGQDELLRKSAIGYQSHEPSVEKYEHIDQNIVTEDILALVSQMSSEKCSCATWNETCLDDQCSNFVNKRECNESNCTNRMDDRVVPVEPRIIPGSISCRGVGVNDVSLVENRIVGEVTGTLIRLADVYKEMHQRQQLDATSYTFHVSGDVFLNCEQSGNEWRHLNHSCEPNAKLVTRIVGGSLRLCVLTLRVISNEEVTIDYRNSGVVLKFGFFCKCETKSCVKVIGPTNMFANKVDFVTPLCCVNSSILKIVAEGTKDSMVKNDVIVDDNTLIDDGINERTYCYKCGTHGEFVNCDKADCKRPYHMVCIESLNRPVGIWLCPVHFCSHCSETATTFCGKCPISSCKKHVTWHVKHACTYKNDGLSDEATLQDVVRVKEEMEVERGEHTNGYCGSAIECVFDVEHDFEDVPIIVQEVCDRTNNEIPEKSLKGAEEVIIEDVAEDKEYKENAFGPKNYIKDTEEHEKSLKGIVEKIMENVQDDKEEKEDVSCQKICIEDTDKHEKSLEGVEMDDVKKVSSVDRLRESRDLYVCPDFDSDDERCDLNPCRVDESEDTITSPCIVDE